MVFVGQKISKRFYFLGSIFGASPVLSAAETFLNYVINFAVKLTVKTDHQYIGIYWKALLDCIEKVFHCSKYYKCYLGEKPNKLEFTT